MSPTIINIIVQAIAGAIGGTAIGQTLKNLTAGPIGNIIIGAVGGGIGGQILQALIPALQGTVASGDPAAIGGSLVGGGVAGAVLTAIVGAVKNKMG
ncbi:MAG: hypothetical protein KF794_11590 [Xanthobacteraceae bacterium]|nr:hypothetical protein [Xanthobacteraceae bacterium]QYK44412.1 MAG: hypothetical protein KF794_11590 [Xanthobacteraceae bacterium]HMN51033.1 hypothetical protein [Xanthobacteraceae bacterium]